MLHCNINPFYKPNITISPPHIMYNVMVSKNMTWLCDVCLVWFLFFFGVWRIAITWLVSIRKHYIINDLPLNLRSLFDGIDVLWCPSRVKVHDMSPRNDARAERQVNISNVLRQIMRVAWTFNFPFVWQRHLFVSGLNFIAGVPLWQLFCETEYSKEIV